MRDGAGVSSSGSWAGSAAIVAAGVILIVLAIALPFLLIFFGMIILHFWLYNRRHKKRMIKSTVPDESFYPGNWPDSMKATASNT